MTTFAVGGSLFSFLIVMEDIIGIRPMLRSTERKWSYSLVVSSLFLFSLSLSLFSSLFVFPSLLVTSTCCSEQVVSCCSLRGDIDDTPI